MKRRDFLKGLAVAGAAVSSDEIRAVLPYLTDEEKVELDALLESDSTSAAELESKGWCAWYAEMFGQSFVDALDSAETEDAHHSEALKWHYEARQALLRGERPPEDFYAYFPTWSRGNMKTTLGRAMLVCDACLSLSTGVGGYALIPAGTKKKGRSTAISLEHLLNSPKIQQYYPLLSRVKRNPYGQSKGWTADFIYTEANYVFHFVGLDEGMAGANVVDVRPTFIMPDDIDSREDSPVISENRFHVFTSEVLPSRQANTLVYWAQNLISRYSVRYRIEKQRDRVLTNRKPTVPIPAVRGLVTETRNIGGIVKDVVVAGKPTWRVWDSQRVQDEIDTYGLPAFLRECQHEVEQDKEGLVLQNYNDAVHVISVSQFESIYGTRSMPSYWNKYVFNDWARTKTKHHANVAGVLTVSAQNTVLPGIVFLCHPMSFPAGSAPEDVAERLLTTISPTVRSGHKVFTWSELIRATLQKLSIEDLTKGTQELIEKRRTLLARVIPPLVQPILRAQNYRAFRGSHEQSKTGALEVYLKYFGLPFRGTNPGGDGGIDKLNFLQKVDYDTRHPFREGKGYSNYYIVVPDDPKDKSKIPGPVPYNESLTPDDLHDHELVRYQFKNWRFRDPHLTVTGEQEGELLKMNDDFGNGHQFLLYDELLSAVPLNYGENLEAAEPELGVLNQKIAKDKTLTPQDQMKFHVLQGMAKKKIAGSGVRRFDESGELIREY